VDHGYLRVDDRGVLDHDGTVGDRIGRRRLLLIGGGMFALASLLAAFSTSPAMLIAARGLLGVAGATLAPSALALIRNMFDDPDQRQLAIAIWISCFAAGAAIGPLLGGALLQHFWWGSVFLVNVPLMAVLLEAGRWLLPESRDPNPGTIDPQSIVLSLASLLATVYGITRMAERGADPAALALVIVGLVVGTVFLRRHRRTDMLVGAAPPERAGAASAVSETATELGGALGIALLGSLGTAIYRSTLSAKLPAGISPSTASASNSTLGEAVDAAMRLHAQLGDALLNAARVAFTHGFVVAAAAAAAITRRHRGDRRHHPSARSTRARRPSGHVMTLAVRRG
jgi:MFS transporter, DHA2 family, multidrug resistance protein